MPPYFFGPKSQFGWSRFPLWGFEHEFLHCRRNGHPQEPNGNPLAGPIQSHDPRSEPICEAFGVLHCNLFGASFKKANGFGMSKRFRFAPFSCPSTPYNQAPRGLLGTVTCHKGVLAQGGKVAFFLNCLQHVSILFEGEYFVMDSTEARQRHVGQLLPRRWAPCPGWAFLLTGTHHCLIQLPGFLEESFH